jgi:hypothetical protein
VIAADRDVSGSSDLASREAGNYIAPDNAHNLAVVDGEPRVNRVTGLPVVARIERPGSAMANRFKDVFEPRSYLTNNLYCRGEGVPIGCR